MDILSLFACFENLVATATRRQLAVIANAVLTLTGRMTMHGIARWTEKGGSYRTVQRFFATILPWTELLVKFFEIQLFHPDREYIVAGDETVVSKAGRQTFGIDRFFSGLKGKVVRGLSFFVLSLVDTVERKSYPLAARQTVRSAAEKAAIKRRKKKRTNKSKAVKGRKKGSLNKDHNELKLSPELWRINELLVVLLKLLRCFVKVGYLAMDGHFGHSQAVLLARENSLELISKLRKDAALFEKYTGEYGGRGAKKKYGARLRYDLLPPKYFKQSEQVGEILTNYYHGIFLHKEFGCALNVVIIVKVNLQTKKMGHALLFSSDLNLSWEKLMDYYSLRFQIEFNFRDAKQHFGLEDFMTRSKTGVENAANLSFLMVNVSAKLLKNSQEKCIGINDLKTQYRGIKYALLTLKKVVKKPEPILMKQIIEEVSRLGSIYQTKAAPSTA
ncbi:MAG: transposase [Acidobacteriota bacterium]|nr:transposase [Acidobacteriota bacterium]